MKPHLLLICLLLSACAAAEPNRRAEIPKAEHPKSQDQPYFGLFPSGSQALWAQVDDVTQARFLVHEPWQKLKSELYGEVPAIENDEGYRIGYESQETLFLLYVKGEELGQRARREAWLGLEPQASSQQTCPGTRLKGGAALQVLAQEDEHIKVASMGPIKATGWLHLSAVGPVYSKEMSAFPLNGHWEWRIPSEQVSLQLTKGEVQIASGDPIQLLETGEYDAAGRQLIAVQSPELISCAWASPAEVETFSRQGFNLGGLGTGGWGTSAPVVRLSRGTYLYRDPSQAPIGVILREGVQAVLLSSSAATGAWTQIEIPTPIDWQTFRVRPSDVLW